MRTRLKFCRLSSRIVILALAALISACGSADGVINAATITSPGCTQIREVFRATKDDFDSIRTGPEISSRLHSQPYFNSKLILSGADSCIIRRAGSGYDYYCRWDTGANNALMGATYQAIRDQLVRCIRQGEIYQNDAGGRTSARIEIEGGEFVNYTVAAQFRTVPFYVYLYVRR